MVMVRSAIKKIWRKSQREAARLQRQADAVWAMEQEEEIHFRRPDTVPDTPRVSRSNTPDPEDGDDRGAKDYTAVLEMVKTVRDRLTALVLRIIALLSDHVIIPGLSVSAVVSWDTPKFVAPNRTHLSHSGQVDGWTGRMDPSEIVEDPHRETKYRPGPNPHWPVCH